jgi:small conductance mechanosensitive channel
VLILAALGFNPLPFLAGAGILGLVVGFGAQSLINDVVSGFFILFENTYLVGDVVEAGGGKGVVEAIEFRTTKIRDRDGRVHVIRNGDVKDVINYSKEYTMAVVPVDIVYDADMRAVFSILREAGERFRVDNPDVLGETEIDGIVAFGTTTMTVRTSTRVKPGRHDAAAAALRFSIKEAFDRRAAGASRRGLVPAQFASQDARDRGDLTDGDHLQP